MQLWYRREKPQICPAQMQSPAHRERETSRSWLHDPSSSIVEHLGTETADAVGYVAVVDVRSVHFHEVVEGSLFVAC